MSLILPRAALDAIRGHGERDYPNECCGLLLGSADGGAAREVREAQPLRNANTDSPRNRFDFDPAEHLAAQRAARERELEVIGFYHSHPDHPARPSQFDLDHAAWPGYSYVIVSIRQGKAGEANSFELAEDRSRFLDEEIEIR